MQKQLSKSWDNISINVLIFEMVYMYLIQSDNQTC